ncbi:hypothetical protein SAMN05518672_103266 [Chitinophaga sp. CF118]|uniref:alpha/beta fold hydrolase n=1 Tax=Chitinophaga sp. CF118 TaxID=1884367 RepID=UPI0008F44B21|nr:alpha/beta fold hydrolase [Chitinophaga sp. CF118]SFD80044.1 hypothetical protein SAMN05518672_103266 [Chitinophaga sp. CF118]
MKNILFVAVILLNGICTMAQADYPAAVEKFKRYYNQQQADSLYSMYAPVMKTVLPLEKTVSTISQLHTQLGELKSVTLTNEEKSYNIYKAVFTSNTFKMVLSLNNDNLLEGFRFFTYTETKKDTADIVLNGIHGTLTIPYENKKVPVVLLIAGSGPTDRNGNNTMGLNTNTYKMLAEALLAKGIACLRYDKRGIGASRAALNNESDVRFEDMINDATGWIKMLEADSRFSKVFVVGHSEGSLIGMIAAARENAAGFISIAGIAESADVTIKKQLNVKSPELAAQGAILLDSLKKGYAVKEPDNNLNSLFRTSVQPYMISWLKYDPQQEIKKLKIPVLIIQGTTDIQVSNDNATSLKKAKPDASLIEIDQMNHVLKQAPAERTANIATYTNPDLPLKKELTEAVVTFVSK